MNLQASSYGKKLLIFKYVRDILFKIKLIVLIRLN